MSEPEPTPAERRRELVGVERDMAAARRLLALVAAGDGAAMHRLLHEIRDSGRALSVLATLAIQALDFAGVLAANDLLRGRDNEPISLEVWLNDAAFEQLDAAAEGERLLGDDDPD